MRIFSAFVVRTFCTILDGTNFNLIDGIYSTIFAVISTENFQLCPGFLVEIVKFTTEIFFSAQILRRVALFIILIFRIIINFISILRDYYTSNYNGPIDDEKNENVVQNKENRNLSTTEK